MRKAIAAGSSAGGDAQKLGDYLDEWLDGRRAPPARHDRRRATGSPSTASRPASAPCGSVTSPR